MANSAFPKATSKKALRIRGVGMLVLVLSQFITGGLLDSSLKLPQNHPGMTGSFFGRGLHGYVWSISNGGGISLTLHTLIATVLVLGAIAALCFARLAHSKAWTIAGVFGLVAVCAAFYNGLVFIDTNLDAHASAMAIASVVALLSYGAGLYFARKE